MGQIRFLYRSILLPSFVGLACFSCGFIPSQQATLSGNELNTTGLATAKNILGPDSIKTDAAYGSSRGEEERESASSKSESDSLSAGISTAAYREGINLASSAYNLSQSAVSPDDWSLISARWQRASDSLKKVHEADENYETAQQKIPEYARNADQATAQLEALQKSASAPLPSRSQAAEPISRPALTSSTPQNQTSAPSQSQTTTAGLPAPSSKQATQTSRSSVAQLPQPNYKSSATQTTTASKTSVQVPIVRRMHGTPIVRVMFNNEQSYEMILDTGASRTLITRSMADQLGVISTGRMTAATASANNVTFDLGQMRSMSLGTVTLSDAQVSIGDTVSIGLLGNDFLKGYDVTIRKTNVELVAAN